MILERNFPFSSKVFLDVPARPRCIQWEDSHGVNTGSSPVGVTSLLQRADGFASSRDEDHSTTPRNPRRPVDLRRRRFLIPPVWRKPPAGRPRRSVRRTGSRIKRMASWCSAWIDRSSRRPGAARGYWHPAPGPGPNGCPRRPGRSAGRRRAPTRRSLRRER